MKRQMLLTKICAAALLVLSLPGVADAHWQIDFETGLAANGYNDVRIPGNTGTRFSLTRDLSSDPTLYWRTRVSHTFGNKHTLSLLMAPLTFRSEGVLEDDLRFAGREFAATTIVKAKYRFDSYRLTYRYDFCRRDKVRIGVGFTGKIRDAAISVEDGRQRAQKSNTGFVPLINLRAQWTISSHFGLLLDGDALAAPQGRAEDVLLAMTGNASRSLQCKIGYRLLEGGADNDEVYTFALVNYLVFGVVWRL
jgi:hypothetical protein